MVVRHIQLYSLMDYSLPGPSARGIFQARILQWATMPSSRDVSNPGIEPSSFASPALAGGFFTTRATWEGFTWQILIDFICITVFAAQKWILHNTCSSYRGKNMGFSFRKTCVWIPPTLFTIWGIQRNCLISHKIEMMESLLQVCCEDNIKYNAKRTVSGIWEAVYFPCVSMSSSSFLLSPADVSDFCWEKDCTYRWVQEVVLPEAASNRAAF